MAGLGNWADIGIIASSTLAVITLTYKGTALFIRRAARIAEVAPVLDKLATNAPTITQLVTIAGSLDLIVKELAPNGGRSLRDAVNGANNGIADIQASLAAHIKQDERVQTELQESQRQLAAAISALKG